MIRTHRNIHEMVSERIKEWEYGVSIIGAQSSGQSRLTVPGPVVTISRESGCDGYAVAELLADKLNLHIFDKEIIDLIAQDKDVTAQAVATLDEKQISDMEEWIYSTMGNQLSSLAYYNSLKRVLFTIVSHGSAVILGRGGNLLVQPEKRIALRLVAPLDVRVGNVMNQTSFNEKQASALIVTTEAERRHLVRKYMDKDIADPTLYDAVINMATIKPETVVHIVKAILENNAKVMSHSR